MPGVVSGYVEQGNKHAERLHETISFRHCFIVPLFFMTQARLQGFSDGVFAIIITFMMLQLRIPEEAGWLALKPLIPVFISYLISFVYLGTYWGNHHQLILIVRDVTPAVIWTNMNVLFWTSLVPFATAWMGYNGFERTTVATYGILMLICSIAFTTFSSAIKKSYKDEPGMITVLGKRKTKTYITRFLYAISIPIALYVHPVISAILFATVILWWILPSKKIEHALSEEESKPDDNKKKPSDWTSFMSE